MLKGRVNIRSLHHLRLGMVSLKPISPAVDISAPLGWTAEPGCCSLRA
jgi:hypothetical protein